MESKGASTPKEIGVKTDFQLAAASIWSRVFSIFLATGTSLTLLVLILTTAVQYFHICSSIYVTLTQFSGRAYGVQRIQPAKRNRFCNFVRSGHLVNFCVKIMLRWCSCICCAVTCKQNGLSFMCGLGKVAREPNETRRMLARLVLTYMQSVLGQKGLIPVGLKEGKL